MEILGQLSIDTGNGGGSVTLSDHLALRQGFRCVTGTGDESIQLRDGVLIQGDVTVDLGRGRNDQFIGESASLRVDGNLVVRKEGGTGRVFSGDTSIVGPPHFVVEE